MKYTDDDSVEEISGLISDEIRENLLVGALEGGSNYRYLIKQNEVEKINKYKKLQ